MFGLPAQRVSDDFFIVSLDMYLTEFWNPEALLLSVMPTFPLYSLCWTYPSAGEQCWA